MAIRMDAGTDRLLGNGFSGAVCTIVCWFKVVVDTNNFANVWIIYAGTETTTVAGFGTDLTGTQFLSFDAVFATQTGPNVTVGTWYCMGMVMNGTTWTLYHGTDPAALTTVGPNTRTALSGPGSLTISNADEPLSGDVANFKMWLRALSAAEVAAELATYSVLDSTNLRRHHRFITSPGLTNEGGDATDLVAGATSTDTVAGPPALHRPIGPRIPRQLRSLLVR